VRECRSAGDTTAVYCSQIGFAPAQKFFASEKFHGAISGATANFFRPCRG
jgi:hypothetical protein